MKTKRKVVRWRYWKSEIPTSPVVRDNGKVRERFNLTLGKWIDSSMPSWSFNEIEGDKYISPAAARRIIKGGGK